MLQVQYLREEQLKGFEKYKYSSIDTSPLSQYVMHPFWNTTVRLVPKWVAPNVLTFTGFVFVLMTAGLISWYDPRFAASSDSIPSDPPVPAWVWLASAVMHFTAHTLDGIDGKQARRTGSSGPLGELFDHGLDSWTSLFTPFCIYSLFGRADFSFSPIRVQFVIWSVFLTFYLSHWEKYNTGILYLPWIYDMTQVALFVMYLLTFGYGYKMWKFTVPEVKLTSGSLFELLTHSGTFLFAVPVAVYNVYIAFRAKTLKHKSFGEMMRPLLPLVSLFILTVGWSYFSPADIINQQPRLFFLMTGTIFSNIACRLIVSQMSSTRCEVVNWLLVPLSGAELFVLSTDFGASQELPVLCLVTVFAITAHVHYGVCVVRQMCRHFGINCFSLKKRETADQDAHQKLLQRPPRD